MNIIHTLSTRPWHINCYNLKDIDRITGTVWYYAVSTEYIKQVSSAVINLHTDELGKEVLGVIPYNNIYTDINTEGIHPRFWAAAKFIALRNEPLNSVHIDGDVFLKRYSLLKEIENFTEDILVQNFEEAKFYKNESELFVKDDYLENSGCKLFEYGAYNTGIIKFNNQELKDKYIKGYFEAVKHYSDKYSDYLTEAVKTTPDLIIEQQRLYQMCKDYTVKLLLPDNPNVDAINKGYQHVISYGKYDMIHRVKQLMEILNPGMYKILTEHCKEIENRIKTNTLLK